MAEENQDPREEEASSPTPEGEAPAADANLGQDGIDDIMGDKPEMDQGDIDALMGADENGDAKPQELGVEQKIIRQSMQRFEKMPMLDVIFERCVLALNGVLKNHTSAAVDASIKGFEYKPYVEAMEALPMPGLLAVANAREWDNDILMALDAPFLYAALEIMLGGRKSDPAKADGRTFTGIERRIGGDLCNVMLEQLGKAFEQLTQVTFAVTRTETNPQFAIISQPQSACIHVHLWIELDGRRGRVDFVIPYSTIEPVRPLLSKVFYGEKLGGDAAWRGHLSERVMNSSLSLTSVLHSFRASLDEVLNWEVGQTLDLRIDPEQEAVVRYGEHELFQGKLGQKKSGAAAIRVNEVLGGRKDLENDLHGN
jgi:flagellar motor switch protein FliM